VYTGDGNNYNVVRIVKLHNIIRECLDVCYET